MRVEKNCRLFTFNLFLMTGGQPFLFFLCTQEEELMRSEKGCYRNVRTSLRGEFMQCWKACQCGRREHFPLSVTFPEFNREFHQVESYSVNPLVYEIGKPWHVSHIQCWYVDKTTSPQAQIHTVQNSKWKEFIFIFGAFFVFWDGQKSFPYRFLPFFFIGFCYFYSFRCIICTFFTKFRNKNKKRRTVHLPQFKPLEHPSYIQLCAIWILFFIFWFGVAWLLISFGPGRRTDSQSHTLKSAFCVNCQLLHRAVSSRRQREEEQQT